MTLVLTVGRAIGAKVVQPLVMTHQQAVQISQVQAQLNSVESENARLEQERTFLSQPAGIEVAARQSGYLRKGEDPLVVETIPAPPPPAPSTPSLMDRLHSAWITFAGR